MVDNPPLLNGHFESWPKLRNFTNHRKIPPPKKKIGEILPEPKNYLEPQTTIYKWIFGETTIFYIKIWNHHPIETSIYKWLALGFQVPLRKPRSCEARERGLPSERNLELLNCHRMKLSSAAAKSFVGKMLGKTLGDGGAPTWRIIPGLVTG